LQDAAGHHSSALFVQWVPYQLAGTTWEAEEDKYTQHLLDIVDSFAPGEPSCLLGLRCENSTVC
jgi:phytoene dehydrogenase-like protein